MNNQTLTNEFPTASIVAEAAQLRIDRWCVGISAHGPEFEYRVAGKPPVVARHLFDAARRFLAMGLSGPFQIVVNGTATSVGVLETVALYAVEESPQLRVRRWRPKSGAKWPAKGWADGSSRAAPLVPDSGTPAEQTASKQPGPHPNGAWSYRTASGAQVTLDDRQWIVIIGRYRHYCRTKAGLQRWIGNDPVLETLPDHFEDWQRANARGDA